MDDVLIPFTMQATMTRGEPPPSDPLDDGPLPLGWVRIPVSFQVTLPAEVLEGGSHGDTAYTGRDGPIAVVPHSLRLGTAAEHEADRTWTDFDPPFAALGADPSASAPVSESAAASHRVQYLISPLPPWRTTAKPPAFEDYDAFLDFMDDPERRPSAAASALASHKTI